MNKRATQRGVIDEWFEGSATLLAIVEIDARR